MLTEERAAIRLATPADLDAIAAIEAACFEIPWSRESLAREIALADRLVLVAEDRQGAVIAYACCWLLPDELHLQRIATLPAHKRQGWAAHLLAAIIGRAQSRGDAAILLEVRAQNEPALSLYRRFGFHEVGRRQGYYPDGTAAVLMDLEVAGQRPVP